MQLTDHSLRQIDASYLERLDEAAVRLLAGKLLHDLKESRERLNQTSQNSSLPPSREDPWKKSPSEATPADAPPVQDEDPVDERSSTADSTPDSDEAAPATAAKSEVQQKRAGKVKGTLGHGRPAPERVDAVEYHRLTACAGCGAELADHQRQMYTGYYEADWVREKSGRVVRITHHLFEAGTCHCGHVTRAAPYRGIEDDIPIGGFRLVGPDLASLIVALSLRFRLSRQRIQAFIDEWLGIWIGTGTIHNTLAEAAVIVAPLEQELVDGILQSDLLHADETPWPEQGASALWLWVFITSRVVLYYISHRGRELVRNLLDGFAGVLMSDGWQAYRFLVQRLRCWAHLKRKAQGLSESFNPAAQSFGREILALWNELWEAVQKAREGPPGQSLRPEWEPRLREFRLHCEKMRGNPHAKTHQLAVEFLNDWEAIFAVLENPRWPLTNNEAERALRQWVILRQISHGTRTPRGSRHFALLASVIDTCRLRGHSPWEYLQTAITRRRQGLSLLPLPG